MKIEGGKKNKRNASNYSCIMIALLSGKAGLPHKAVRLLRLIHLKYWQSPGVTFWQAPNFVQWPLFLTSYSPLAPSQRVAVFMMRWWSQGTLTWCSPQKNRHISRPWLAQSWGHVSGTRALNEELTSRTPTPRVYRGEDLLYRHELKVHSTSLPLLLPGNKF